MTIVWLSDSLFVVVGGVVICFVECGRVHDLFHDVNDIIARTIAIDTAIITRHVFGIEIPNGHFLHTLFKFHRIHEKDFLLMLVNLCRFNGETLLLGLDLSYDILQQDFDGFWFEYIEIWK